MLRSLIIAHNAAARVFPLLIVELYLVMVTLWIGSTGGADARALLPGFYGWFSVFCVGAFVSGLVPGWTTRTGQDITARLGGAIVEGLHCLAYFAAISFMRGKPWKFADAA